MAMTTGDPPFKRLSTELRNKIYELVLYHGHITIGKAEAAGDSRFDQTKILQGCQYARPLAITGMCKQFHEEAMKMFFDMNSFTFAVNFGKCFYFRIDEFRRCVGDENFKLMGPLTVRIYFNRGLFGHPGTVEYVDKFFKEAKDVARLRQLSKLNISSFEYQLNGYPHQASTKMVLDVSSTRAMVRSICTHYYSHHYGGSRLMDCVEISFHSSMLKAMSTEELKLIDQEAVALKMQKIGTEFARDQPTFVVYVTNMPEDGYLGPL